MNTLSKDQCLSGIQWFFFIFCNTVVIPPTLQSAFHLSDSTTLCLMQYSFIVTGLACISQAAFGHRRAIMEGPTGLWWGTLLTVTLAESAQGTPLPVIGGSLAVGIIISGVLNIMVGLTGLGHRLAVLFKPGVMVVFMFLLSAQLVSLFLKGMLGLPFGVQTGPIAINFPAFFLALALVVLVIYIIVIVPPPYNKYSLLAGTLVGWGLYSLIFTPTWDSTPEISWHLFLLGRPDELRSGIVITAVLAGLVNISNTYGAIRGTDVFYPDSTNSRQIYRRSFVTSGIYTLVAAVLGLVPFSPFVSSVGLLTQTNDSRRFSFIIGCVIFMLIGLLSSLTIFFSHIPLSISSAVLLVSYLPLLSSSLLFLKQINLNARNVYRLAIPLFFGIFLMGLPAGYLQDIPLIMRPLLSNGLLMGVLLAIMMENMMAWDKIR
ncbi:uracil/xanthine transporter [Budvicia diplopodorum]|uniref:uracil/xanthine transporter n=1 Tax=Budvicia diplopodorum TaxID=1119056 RepID=UPI00135A7EF7|nr:uracil/xanthine transporter [Budvicia diplopodorum]